MQWNNGDKTFIAGEALTARRLVKISGSDGQAYLCTAGQVPDGYVSRDYAAGDHATVHDLNTGGTCELTAAGAFSIGASLFPQDAGKVDDTGPGYSVGIAREAATANGDIVEVDKRCGPEGSATMYVAVAASANVTNTNTETAFDVSFTIKKNTLKVGDKIRIRARVSAPTTNSTDTLTLKLKIGSTVVVATGAVDVADGDAGIIDAELTIRTIGASGTFVASGHWVLGVPGTATVRGAVLASTVIDTTADQAVTVTATWSVASASNICALQELSGELVRR